MTGHCHREIEVQEKKRNSPGLQTVRGAGLKTAKRGYQKKEGLRPKSYYIPKIESLIISIFAYESFRLR